MKKKRILHIAILLAMALPLLTGCSPKPVWQPLWTTPAPGSQTAPPPTKDPNATYAPSDYFTTDTDHMQNPSIVINKTKHTLEVYDGQMLMARMKVALGKTPGAKKRSGDNKTPEGSYYVCGTEEASRYYKSLYLSYPNSDDAYAGLNANLIKQDKYDDIVSAIDRRLQPDWTTDLGGEIAISGTGNMGQGKTGQDWTVGNIVVSDKDMDYLYKFIPIGTDVQINP